MGACVCVCVMARAVSLSQLGDTPLHLACQANMPELVRYLLRKGAKKHAMNAVRTKPPQATAPPGPCSAHPLAGSRLELAVRIRNGHSRSGCASSAAFRRGGFQAASPHTQSPARNTSMRGWCPGTLARGRHALVHQSPVAAPVPRRCVDFRAACASPGAPARTLLAPAVPADARRPTPRALYRHLTRAATKAALRS
jgi:hypothetical protein